MKKIINGKLYGTDTANKIGSYCNGCGAGDFNYLYEALYRKKTGEFFLYESGGAMTQYSVACGNNCWSGGESIIPFTEEEAKEWAEEHIDADTYMEMFGTVEE